MTPRYIGITSTIPVEIVYAAGAIPVDLNNAFIVAADPLDLISQAENAGFARNYCAWIKGIFGALQRRPEISEVIGVVQGDCANTNALLDLLRHRGYKTYSFAYPSRGEGADLGRAIDKLARELAAPAAEIENWRTRLNGVRRLALEIDRMTWEENRFSGEENHLALIDTSDFRGNPDSYSKDMALQIEAGQQRPPLPDGVRLGMAGVPPITSDIFSNAAELGARVVYNEVQREFAMPRSSRGLVEQYLGYTYPYGAGARAPEIAREASRRCLDGLVHYVQSFCYHQLDEIIIRETAGVPVLSLEADKPGLLDARNRLRLEAFVETLSSGLDVR